MSNTFTNYGNPGHSGYARYGINNLSVARKVILLPPGTQIATSTLVATQATWTTLIKNPMATRVHPLPLAIDVKPGGADTVFSKTKLSGNVPIRSEPYSLELDYDINQILHTELLKFNFKKWDVVLVDAFDNIMGYTPDGTKFQGFSTVSVHFSDMEIGTEAKEWSTKLTINFANNKEWNMSPAMVSGDSLSWYPSLMDGTTGVNLAITASTTAAWTISVIDAGYNASDPRGQRTGLAKADFTATKDGSAHSLSGATMVDNGNGTYTFTETNTAGVFVVTLVACASISVTTYNIEPLATCTFTLT
jgi:hypothetical protein